MVDGVLLLVDASEGPLPQTRFVLRKTLEAHLPVILVVNKVDRPDARIAEVVDEVYDLFIDLDADDAPDRVPDRLRQRPRRMGVARRRTSRAATSSRCASSILEHIPAPEYEEGHPFQALVTNLDASPYLGRLALCRVRNGYVRRAEQVAWCRLDGTIERAKIVELYLTDALDRVSVDEAGPGDIIAVAGFPDITIGETLADARRSAPAAAARRRRAEPVDDDRHQHVAARGQRRQEAHRAPRRVAAAPGARRQRVAARLRRPSVPTRGRCRAAASCSSRCSSRRCAARASSSPSASRRSSPRRSTASCTSRSSALTIDVPEEYLGVVSQMLGAAQGPHGADGQPRHRLGAHRLPAFRRARLIGFRTEFLTETRGTGMMHHVFDGLRAVVRRAAHAAAAVRWSPTGAACRPGTP